MILFSSFADLIHADKIEVEANKFSNFGIGNIGIAIFTCEQQNLDSVFAVDVFQNVINGDSTYLEPCSISVGIL